MIQVPYVKPDRYIRCPSCGKGESRVDHLSVGSTAGPWWCEDCGCGMKVEVISDAAVKVEATGAKKIVTDVHLILDAPDELPLRLIVEGMAFGKVGQSDDEILAEWGEHDAYFYEEHSCPPNYFRCVKGVIAADGDDDRHGIFAWERTVPVSVATKTALPLLDAPSPEKPEGT